MITIAVSAEVARPVADVYDFIVNVENVPKWQPAVIESRRVTPGPVRVGAEFTEVAKLLGRRVETVCTFTELEPNRTIAFHATSSGPFSYDTRYTLEPAGSGTRIQIAGRFRFKGLWRLLEPILGGEVRKESAQEVQAMKAAIEGRPPAIR